MQFKILISFLLLSTILSAQKSDFTLDQIYKDRLFKIEGVEGFQSTDDGEHYTTSSIDEDVYRITKKSFSNPSFSMELFSSESLEIADIEGYNLSPDENFIMLYTDGESIYRRSRSYIVYVYNRDKSQLEKISEDHILHADLSPDNSKVAYVSENNLFIKDINNKNLTQVTTDGKQNAIINGNCDWVYEEEFGFTQAFQWSPDSRHIAFYRFDETDVREYTLEYYEDLYPRLYTYKYPKAGEANSKLSLHSYTLATKANQVIDLPISEEYYIPRIFWASGDRLVVQTLDRLQQEMKLWSYNPEDQMIANFYQEHDSRYVEVTDNIHFLDDNTTILTSEKDGYNHIYCISPNGKKIKQLTHGKWEVREIKGIDPDGKYIYYTSTEITPVENHLFRITTAGKKKTRLTKEQGWHDINFTSGMKYFLDAYSNLSKPSSYTLRRNDGSSLRELQNNNQFLEKYSTYNTSITELTTIAIGGIEMNTLILKPWDFNPNKKYPVLLYQYSGPGSQLVKNEFLQSSHFVNQILTQKGYIVVIMDGRGTGGRGAEFKKQTYRQLGKYESDDQIALAQWLAQQNYVDKDRIGIWGWSYGGYMSSICILKGADVFKTAVAVAPVTNWRYYDNIYTERYMGLPADNGDGYDDNSPTTMASELKGNFLMIHGLTDDNVHFQNSAMLNTALVKAGKQFDAQYYPNVAHGMGYARLNLYHKLIDYLEKNL